jgi:pimeloyl-ACP methyl ester carboxylesterase
VQQVWVKTIGKDDGRIITADEKRGIPFFFWAENSKVLVYVQDSNGGENYHLYGVDLASGTVRDFTPQKGVRALTMRSNPSFPDEILIMLNTRDDRALDSATIGNIDDPRDADLLHNASPLFKADQIVRPLLIGQGANDVRVTQSESDQIVPAIEKSGGNVSYVLYPDEGHMFQLSENIIDFNARMEAFLAQYLGGRAEPIVGDRYPGSTPVVRVIGK